MLSSRLVQFLTLGFFIGFLILINSFGLYKIPKGYFLSLTQPVVRFADSTTLKIKDFFYSAVTIRQQLKNQVENQAKMQQLASENAMLKHQRLENQRLRLLLDLKNTKNFATVAAEVVNRDPTGIFGIILIDKGENMGISSGDAVLDESGNLVGIVHEVFKSSSEVLLITDGETKIDAIVTEKKALGAVFGSHSLGLNLDLISQEIQLEKGDEVVTSGLTGTIPSGILIGYVDQLHSSESELFQKVSVIPAADLKKFKFVLVITNF